MFIFGDASGIWEAHSESEDEEIGKFHKLTLDDVKNKISNSKKGKPKSEIHKQKMSEAKKGKIFNIEHKKNLKKTKKLLTCPICGKTGGSNAIKRFHFDNCGKPYIFKRNK